MTPARRFRAFLLAALLALFAPVLQAAPGGVFRAPYTHYAHQEPLSDALADFARAQGYRADVSDALARREGRLSGRFDKIPPRRFLESMERAFGAHWYLSSDATLHFYHASEFRRIFLQAPSLGVDALFRQLMETGMVSAQLPLEPPRGGRNVLAIGGPEPYVQAVAVMAERLDQASVRSVMRVFRLKYASADDLTVESMGRKVTVPGVASLLRAMVTGQGSTGGTVKTGKATVEKLKGSGLAAKGADAAPAPEPAGAESAGGVSIVADPRVNAVVVQDLVARMPYYEQVIGDLDKETHLIEIHAAIVDIDSDYTRELGLTWGGRRTNGNVEIGGEVSLPQPGDAGGILSTIYTHGNSYFVARIQAMEKNGVARMLGRPSVLTTDNLEATLENITTYYVSVRGQEEVDLFKVEAGTVLRVTPHIIENTARGPSIKLSVTMQDDQENSGAATTGDMAIPPIKQTKINTQAIIDAGQSLLIGGYYYEEKRTGEDGVPGLMHLPLLGNLFKSTTTSTRLMERLVLITPRIIRLGENNALPAQVSGNDFLREPGQADYAPRDPVPAGFAPREQEGGGESGMEHGKDSAP
ncbi:EscC/YscC/HrcC family type III secretion system outer membrane ring protein [Betaproteobacteria bacterium]|nr:EscC/YscC/HrcC family type III secretion system outer membrane ring protein [Betaproteobacteria bacterium]